MTRHQSAAVPAPVGVPTFEVNGRLVIPALNRVVHEGATQQIEPQVMFVLVCLVNQAGELITRETLLRTVWGDSVVCEEVLTGAISRLRRLLGDDSKKPQVIETIRKRGYRLVAPVNLPDEADGESGEDATNERRRTGTGIGWIAAALGSFVAMNFLVFLSMALWRIRQSDSPVPPVVRPVTSYPGVEMHSALSPDGSMVAFSRGGKDRTRNPMLDLYVQPVVNGVAHRLTHGPYDEKFAAWSPDGTVLAFTRENPDFTEICIVPVLGGTVRTLATVRSMIVGLDWSPDGDTIAYSAVADSGFVFQVHLLSRRTGERSVLTSPPEHGGGDIMPCFSPDGRRVGFIRVDSIGQSRLCLMSVNGGEVGCPIEDRRDVTGLDWITNDEMLISTATMMARDIRRLHVADGLHGRLPLPGAAQRPSAAKDGKRFVYEEIRSTQNIWSLDIVDKGRILSQPQPLIESSRMDHSPAFSPDGISLAFISNRTGNSELWLAAVDGSWQEQLTEHVGVDLARPAWSPDGKRIAYSLLRENRLSLFVTDVEPGTSRRLLEDDRHLVVSHWSHSEQYLYYLAASDAGWEVWRVRGDGSNQEQVLGTGYTIIGETPDGTALYCLRDDEAGIWRFSVDDDRWECIVAGDLASEWVCWAVADEGFYFVQRHGDRSFVGYYALASESSELLQEVNNTTHSLTLSPDQSTLLVGFEDSVEMDIMLVDLQ